MITALLLINDSQNKRQKKLWGQTTIDKDRQTQRFVLNLCFFNILTEPLLAEMSGTPLEHTAPAQFYFFLENSFITLQHCRCKENRDLRQSERERELARQTERE